MQNYFSSSLLLQSLHCFAWTHNFNAKVSPGPPSFSSMNSSIRALGHFGSRVAF